MLQRAGVPGCALALGGRGGQTSLQLGWADVAEERLVEPTTVFHLFSGTKLYTATAVMLLHERGSLDLDRPIGDYLDLELRHPVTPRQLLSHCSGLSDTLAGFLAVHFEGNPPSTSEALCRYRTAKGRRPGQRVAYRNVNYAILGELVTSLSGVSFVQFVDRELLRPLGSGAAFAYSEIMRQRAATGYIGRFDPMRWLLRFMMPEVSKRLEGPRVGSRVSLNTYVLDTAAIGGLLGTATDFLPLAMEFLDPTDRLLTSTSKQEMLTLQCRGSAGITSTDGVGLGWKRGHHGGVTFWNHEGAGAGFTSETRIYPDDGLGVVILMNTTHNRKLSLLADAICEVLREALV
jgi:CubicO group peptidase (beta-lactamase class C family)